MLTLLVGSALATAAWYVHYLRAPDAWLRAGEDAIARGDFANALQLAERVLERVPDSLPALLIGAQASFRLGDVEQSLTHLRTAARIAPPADVPEILQEEVAVLLEADRNRIAEIEAPLRRLAQLPNPSLQSLKTLNVLFQLEARRWEALPLLLQILQRGEATLNNLLHLGNPDAMYARQEEVDELLAATPACKLPLVASARNAAFEERYADAERLLREVLAAHPDSLEAWVRLGQLLAQTGQRSAGAQWAAECPSAAQEHPIYWLALGMFYEQQHVDSAAARCFWETLRRDPHNLYANHQLAGVLRRLDRAADAEPFDRRAEIARATLPAILKLSREHDDLQLTLDVARGMAPMGRLWEAWAWYGRVLELAPHNAEAVAQRAKLERHLHPGLPQTLPEAIPALNLDLSSYELPPLTADPTDVVAITPTAAVDQARAVGNSLPAQGAAIHFVEATREVTLDFRYFEAPDPSTAGERMQETTGGGLAVLDYDLDGWPDLFFTQGCEWPPDAAQRTHLDQLYRNVGGERVVNVTPLAECIEPHFGQGVASGDFDSDGFPDLYVGNIGPNTLWENLGDGTFRQLPLPEKTLELGWTASCLLADLNADGHPDIYDAHYVTGPGVYSKICQNLACSPGEFMPERDRMLLNLGDGGFREITDEAGVPGNDGNGLGVVAWPDDDSGRLNLFVANDQTHNLFLVHENRERGGPIRLLDQGVVSGLAFDSEGRPQGSMGIATDDADGDSELDLFVTNFYKESNAIYLHQGSHSYLDASRPTGLRAPSFYLVGFGTQFLDADLDTWPDLVISNGYIGDYRSRGEPYRMRPQFMYNLGDAKFVEVPAEQLGPYFTAEHLGRSLAKLDFDRDGKEDFAVSPLHEPAALVRNATEQTGHALRLQLRGVASNRDALGAVLTIRTQERTFKKFMVAGGGYMACNEMQIVAGLGPATEVLELSILWPSGVVQTCGPLPADTPLLWVEGRPLPVVMPAE